MEAFLGKFNRTSEEGYDNFLTALNLNYLLRKAATVSSPTLEILKECDAWVTKTSTVLKTIMLKFKLNEEFDDTTPDGRQVKTMVTFEDGKIVTLQTAVKEGQKSTRSTLEMRGSNELVYELSIVGEDVTCSQIFTRIP